MWAHAVGHTHKFNLPQCTKYFILIQLATPRNIISAALVPSPTAHGDIVGIYLHADPSTVTWARVCDLPHQLTSYDELWLDTGRHPHDTGSKVIIHHSHIIAKASLWIESARQYDEYLGGEPDDDAPVTTKISVQGLETSVYPTDAGWFIDGQEPRDGNDAPRRLSNLSIHNMTKVKTALLVGDARPNCEAAWEKRLAMGPFPWDKIWKSVGTPLTNAEDENVWFRLIHRAIFVHNRDTSHATGMCRLECGERESQLHLLQCVRIKPVWDKLREFIKTVLDADSESPAAAIILGLRTPSELLPEDARALLRLALWKVYSAFSAVDLKDHEWSPHEPYLAALEALRRALVSYAAHIKKLYARRLHASLENMVPEEARDRFKSLVSVDEGGRFTIDPVLETEIETAAKAHNDEQKTNRRRERNAASARARRSRP